MTTSSMQKKARLSLGQVIRKMLKCSSQMERKRLVLKNNSSQMAKLSSFYPCPPIPLNSDTVRLEKAGILVGQRGQCRQWVDTQGQQQLRWSWWELPMWKHPSTTLLTIHSTIPTTSTPLLMARMEWVLGGVDFLKTNSLVPLLKSFWTSRIRAPQQDISKAIFQMKLMEA